MCATLASNPIDVAKTRAQLSLRVNKSPGQLSIPIRSIKRIAAREGFAGLYSGFKAGALFNLTLNSVRFGVYGSATHGKIPSTSEALLWGGLAGGTAGIMASPFAKLRTCTQAKPTWQAPTIYKALKIVRKTGWFAGAWLQALRVSSTAGIQFATYETMKQYSTCLGSPGDIGVVCVSAVTAGIVTGVGVTPIDTILTRMYNGQQGQALQCALKAMQYEGTWHGLYKGLGHNILRTTVHGSVTFVIYEQLRSANILF